MGIPDERGIIPGNHQIADAHRRRSGKRRLAPAQQHPAPGGRRRQQENHGQNSGSHEHEILRVPSSQAAGVGLGAGGRALCATVDQNLGPLDANSDLPSAETQIAATPAMVLTSSLPFSGPTSNNVVESASEAVPVLATTLTVKAFFPARHCLDRLCGPPAPATGGWAEFARRWKRCCRTASRRDQPGSMDLSDAPANRPDPEEHPARAVVLPPASSSARETPCARSTAAAWSRA